MAVDQTSFTDSERAAIEQVAVLWGVTFEEAVSRLGSDGLAARVRKQTGRRPAANVTTFRKTRADNNDH